MRATYDEQAGRCFYTGLAFGDTGTINALSVDRIVLERGYTKNNIILCLLWVNVMKSDHPVNEFFSKILMIAKNIDRLRSQERLGPYLEDLQLEIGGAPLQKPFGRRVIGPDGGWKINLDSSQCL